MATQPTPLTIFDYALAALNSGNYDGYNTPRSIAEHCFAVAEQMMQQQERYEITKGKKD